MLNKKIVIPPLVGICLIGIFLGAYKASAAGNNTKAVDQQPALVYQDEHIQKLSNSPRVIADVASSSDPIDQPAITNDKTDGKIKELVAQGKLIEAKEGYTYAQKKLIIVNKRIGVGLEGYRVSVDRSSYSMGKYYVIVDFSILNLSNTNYMSSVSDFMLSDSSGYTYTPMLGADTRGDISGDLKLMDSRRGEIAFYVPGNETRFELNFNTGISALKTVRFNFDTDSLINPPLPNQQAPSSVDDQQAPY